MTNRMTFLSLWLVLLGFFSLVFAEEPGQETVAPPQAAPSQPLPALESGKVELSWREMKTLLDEIEFLKQALKKDEPVPEAPAPTAYTVREARFDGEAGENTARFTATFAIHVLSDTWTQVPLLPASAGIESLALEPDANAQFLRDEQGYSLLVKGPAELSVTAVLHLPITSDERTFRLEFTPPPAVINPFTLRIPETGVRLVHAPARGQVHAGENRTQIDVIQREPFHLAWRIEKDNTLTRKSRASQHTLVSVDRAELVGHSRWRLEAVADLAQVQIRLPASVEIVELASPGIERWSSAKQGEAQVITLVGSPSGPLNLDLHYRARLRQLPAEVDLPLPVVTGVDQLESQVGVEVRGNLEVTAAASNQSIPPKNLDKSLWQRAANPLLLGYHFFQPELNAKLHIRGYQEIQTVVANADGVEAVTLRTLEGRGMTRVVYAIRNNDRQFLTLKLPEKSRVWQAFLDGKPVKPARKDDGSILVPMKKSHAQGEHLQSFRLELGYITEVNKLSLKGDILNQLPAIDIPISYLRWRLYLPEYYEYSNFEGPLKQVPQFSANPLDHLPQARIDIPLQGQVFLFEKHLIVNEMPYVGASYGQFLGDDILLSLHPGQSQIDYSDPLPGAPSSRAETKARRQQVIPNRR